MINELLQENPEFKQWFDDFIDTLFYDFGVTIEDSGLTENQILQIYREGLTGASAVYKLSQSH